MDRRSFNTVLVGAAATSLLGCTTHATKASGRTVLYQAVGDKLTQFEVDVETATLTQRASVTLPSAVQYAWIHPSQKYIYVSTSDAPGGAPAGAGKIHRLCALRVGADGALAMHGEPQVLSARPIHNSVDARGEYALTCYNAPANLTIHRINADGTLGAEVTQEAKLDMGNFPHQIRTTPDNSSVVLVTRGVSATAGKPEDPGALKLFNFRAGKLSPLANIVVGGKGGFGYGPRHMDFHPGKPWAYVLIERQNELHMHTMQGGNLAPVPSYIKSTLERVNPPEVYQIAGAIHVHPRGHVVYTTNRASRTVEFKGQQVFQGGQNTIVAFAINPMTGEPTAIQYVEPEGFHVRAFSIDPTGRLLIAATMQDMLVREGDSVRRVTAGLSLFRIADDGRLNFIRKYDVAVGQAQQVWVNMLTLPA